MFGKKTTEITFGISVKINKESGIFKNYSKTVDEIVDGYTSK